MNFHNSDNVAKRILHKPWSLWPSWPLLTQIHLQNPLAQKAEVTALTTPTLFKAKIFMVTLKLLRLTVLTWTPTSRLRPYPVRQFESISPTQLVDLISTSTLSSLQSPTYQDPAPTQWRLNSPLVVSPPLHLPPTEP